MGANLARRLLARGHEVHLLLRPSHRPWRLEGIRDQVTVHSADLGDAAQVEAAVMAAEPGKVFHLAAYGAYSHQQELAEITRVNFLGAVHLLQACRRAGVAVMVNAGSSSEYGYADHAPSEDERLEPNSYYAVTKAAATHACRLEAGGGLRAPTLRLYSVYGPWEEPSRFIPTLIRHGLAGTLPPLVNPDVARDFVHVDDVVDAMLLAAGLENGQVAPIYNLGTGKMVTIAQAVDLARDLMGIKAQPVWGSMADRRWDTDVWVSDPSLAKAELSWQPGHDFASGLAATVQWYRSRPHLLED